MVGSGIIPSSAEMGLQIWAHRSHPSTAALASVTCIQALLGVAGSPRAPCQGPAMLGGMGAGTLTLNGPVGLDSPTSHVMEASDFTPVPRFLLRPSPTPPPIPQGAGPWCLESLIPFSGSLRRIVFAGPSFRHRDPGSRPCQPSVQRRPRVAVFCVPSSGARSLGEPSCSPACRLHL